MQKKDYSEINKVIADFVKASYNKHGNYAYAAGSLQAHLAWLVTNELKANQQNEFVRSVEAFTKEELLPKV